MTDSDRPIAARPRIVDEIRRSKDLKIEHRMRDCYLDEIRLKISGEVPSDS